MGVVGLVGFLKVMGVAGQEEESDRLFRASRFVEFHLSRLMTRRDG